MARQSQETQIAVVINTVTNIEKTVEDIKKKMEGSYVTKEEFEPIKRVVYGLVGLILVAVVGGMLALVIR